MWGWRWGEGEPSNTCRGLQRRSYAMSVSSQREGGVRVTVCVCLGVRRWRGKGGGRGRLGIVCIFRQIPGFQRLPGSTREASSDTRCFTLCLLKCLCYRLPRRCNEGGKCIQKEMNDRKMFLWKATIFRCHLEHWKGRSYLKGSHFKSKPGTQ